MKNKKVQFVLNPITVCMGILLLGILLVVVSFIEFKEPAAWWVAWGKSSISTLGTTLVGSSVISLVLEISNIKSIFSDTMKNVLGNDFPIDAYSKENLSQFEKRIFAYMCEGNVEPKSLDNSIYEYEEYLKDEIVKPFYGYHNGKYIFTPNAEKGIIKVHVELNHEIENRYQKENNFKLRLKTFSVTQKSSEEDFSENFELKHFEINKEEQDKTECVKIEVIDKKTNKSYYDYKIIIQKNLKKDIKKTTIKFGI